MRRKDTKTNRLSPNEEEQLIRAEVQRRRKLRLQQVREQERCIALQRRREVQERTERQLQILGTALRDEWQKQREERIHTLEKLYRETLRDVGHAHRNAEHNEPDREALARKREQNNTRAAERHQQALRNLITQRREEAERRNRLTEARKKALMVEKQRAANIAGLPHAAPDPVESVTVKAPLQPKTSNMQHYSITHYNVPEAAVDREADTVQLDAQEAAEVEVRRLEALEKEERRHLQERLERARLRGDHALRKEKGVQDNARLLCELEKLQQAELQRRRYTVYSVPARIFQPLYRHTDLRAEQQNQLENAFHDMLTEDKEVRDELVLQLVSEPLPPPVPSAKTDSIPESDLDVTVDPNETPCEEEEKDAGQEPVASQSSSLPAEDTGRTALRKLLSRIRTQRDQWSTGEPPEARGKVRVENRNDEHKSASDPECQQVSSIEEGTVDTSLAEKNSERSADSITAEPTVQPDKQEVDMDCLSRDEELNRQRVEQFALLQELEEKRRRLELQLEEAKLHRLQEALQVPSGIFSRQEAVQVPSGICSLQEALQVPSGICSLQEGPTSPLQETVSELSPEVTVLASLSDSKHKQRLHHYQQRLLRQSRLHQKTIDEARRNLEEYKQTLRIRYARVAMTAAETPSDAVCSAAITHPLNGETESRISCQTLAANINTTPADTSMHNPSVHPDTCVTAQPIPMPVSIVATIPQPAAGALLDKTISDGISEHQDAPLLPPAVFLEYLRNRRSRVPLAPLTPSSQPDTDDTGVVSQEKVENDAPLWDRERIEKQRDAVRVLLKAQQANDTSLIQHNGAVIDAPLKEKSNVHFLVSTSNQSQQSSVWGSREHSARESASDGRVNPPVSCPPRTLQILLHDFEQHKLSTIEEVDTPMNVSINTDAEAHTESSLLDSLDYSCSLGLTPPTKASESSQGPSSGSEVIRSEVSSCRPNKLSWREMLQLESAASHTECFSAPHTSATRRHEEELELVFSSDGTSAIPDLLSSTTLSTGSYISSERELNGNVTDNSLLSNEFSARSGASLSCNSSSVQYIIDKYTKELDSSLRTVNTGGSVSELTAPESVDTRCLTAAQSPMLPLKANVEDSDFLNSTMRDHFQFLSPEITNDDTTERSAAFRLALNTHLGNTDTTASDWLDSQHTPTTDQSSFTSVGFPQWEWTLGNNSELRVQQASVSHEEGCSLQNTSELMSMRQRASGYAISW